MIWQARPADRASGQPLAAGLGEAVIGGAGTELVAYGLGSCIGLAIWSPRRGLGVFSHIVLADSGSAAPNAATPARYADRAVPWAVAALEQRGAARGELKAKLAGGAQVLGTALVMDIGRHNAEATLAGLRALGIPVLASDLGGRTGRTVRFFPASGVMEVRLVGGPPVLL